MAEPTNVPAEFIPIAEAARRIGVSRDCIYRALKQGDVPGGKRFGGRWVIARAPFEAWLLGIDQQTQPVYEPTGIDFMSRRKSA